jgi:hypothetical protein
MHMPTSADLGIITPNFDFDSQMLRLSLEDFLLAPFELPRALPRAFLSEGNSYGSVDWPPTVSSPFPGDGNARHDEVPETRAEFVNLIADRIFPGSIISDVDRESPFCAPVWTPDSLRR